MISVRKVYKFLMNLKPKVSLGVTDFAWFSKMLCFKTTNFWKSTKSAILELLRNFKKYLYFQCFCEFHKRGIYIA